MLFLEHESFPIRLGATEAFQQLFETPNIPSAYNHSKNGLVDANALPDSGILYSLVPGVVVRLFTDGMLKSALCLPSDFQSPCKLSQLLTRVFGGIFKLLGRTTGSLPL